MPDPQRLRARLEDAGGGGAVFTVPPGAVAALGDQPRTVERLRGGHEAG